MKRGKWIQENCNLRPTACVYLCGFFFACEGMGDLVQFGIAVDNVFHNLDQSWLSIHREGLDLGATPSRRIECPSSRIIVVVISLEFCVA